jgi:hypothetical protein
MKEPCESCGRLMLEPGMYPQCSRCIAVFALPWVLTALVVAIVGVSLLA